MPSASMEVSREENVVWNSSGIRRREGPRSNRYAGVRDGKVCSK